MNCRPSPSSAPIWRDIVKGRSILSKVLMALIGNGQSVSLWFHRWVGECPLVDIITSPMPPPLLHWKVSNIIDANGWSLNDISFVLPHYIIPQIFSIHLPFFTPPNIASDGIFFLMVISPSNLLIMLFLLRFIPSSSL